jgi:hypothetical protein
MELTRMAISVAWANPDKKIVIVTFIGSWFWRDFEVMCDDLVATLSKVEHKADIIFDISQSSLYEPNTIEYIREHHLVPRVSNWRLLIIIGADYFTQVLWKVFTSLPDAAHYKSHFYDSLEEAINFAQGYTENNE